jgi:hypothetical protein
MANATKRLASPPTFFDVDRDLFVESDYVLPDSAVRDLQELLGADPLTLEKITKLSEWCTPARKQSPFDAESRRLRFASIAKSSAQLLADLGAVRDDLHLPNGLGANPGMEAPYSRPALFLTDLNSVGYVRRGAQELTTLWQSLYALNRTAMDLAQPSGIRGRRQDSSRILAVIAIGHWFGNVLQRQVTLSRDGEFARTLAIVLPHLGHSCPEDLLPLMRSAKRLWKLGARIPSE